MCSSDLGRIFCFDGLTYSLLSEWTVRSGGLPSIALSSNGRFIACAIERSISIWDTSTRQRIGPIIEDPQVVYCIAISPDNMFLASGGHNTMIMLRSLRDFLPQGYLTSDVSILSSIDGVFILDSPDFQSAPVVLVMF